MQITEKTYNLLLSLILLAACLGYGCGAGSKQQTAISGQSVRFGISLYDKSHKANASIDCDSAGLDTIAIFVYEGTVSSTAHRSGLFAGSQNPLVKSVTFNCNEHKGTMDGLPPGSLTFIIEGVDLNGDTVYIGTPIVTVIDNGRITDIGTVTLRLYADAAVDTLLSFTLPPSGIEGDYSSFELLPEGLNAPNGASLDTGTQVFSWRPTCNQKGMYRFQFNTEGDAPVSQTLFVYVSDSGTICTINPNLPPQFASSVKDSYNVTVDSQLSLNITASDFNGDKISITVKTGNNLPAGASFTPAAEPAAGKASGIFTWTPDDGNVGTNQLCLTVTENETELLSTSKCINLEVALNS